MVARGKRPPAVCYLPPVRRSPGPRLALAALAAAACVAAPRAPGAGAPAAPPADRRPLVGYTLHWDFFATPAEGERLLAFALANGAEVLNVVPPPHVWEDPTSLALLRRIFAEAHARGVGVVLNRIDGSTLADADGDRRNWLYGNVLTEPGRLPSGAATPDFFLATVGNPEYERWLREETAYYAENFSAEPALLAFGVGGFNEPFVSQRGSLLCWDPSTESYEVAQYTPWAAAVWRRALAARYGGVAGANARYRTAFASLADVPLPRNESDPAFGDAPAAYWDFVAAVNGWFVRQLDACRSLWHARARRNVPFMLQLSGYVPEKLEKGRPAFAALDLFDWMTRADALGLSAYTDCGYPDGGRASVVAMVNFLRLGPLLGKPVWVLEGGNECDGALLDEDGLRFFATVAAPLRPASVIYEFLSMSYAERFATSAGKLAGLDGVPRPRAVAAVRAALATAKAAEADTSTTYVLDDVAALPGDTGLLAERRRLARLAVERPITFVPPRAVAALPRGAVLVVPSAAAVPAWRDRLAARGVAVAGPEALPAPLPQ